MSKESDHRRPQKQSQRRGDLSTPNALWTNMARIGSCKPREHHYPQSVGDVVALVKRLKQSGQKCRVVGGGKSPNTITFTDGHLIHMDHLNRVLSVDKEKRTITCEGGVLLRDMFEHLTEHGLMLRCVPSYVVTTIAGAIGTATHGSGTHTKCLSDYVLRIVLVDGNGELHTYDTTRPKELSLVACHLGVLGVVVEVTIQAEVKRMWKVRSSPVSVETLIHGDTLAKRVGATEFYRFFWVPNTNHCYETVGIYADEADESPVCRETLKKPHSICQRVLHVVKTPPVDTYRNWQVSRQHPRTRLCEAARGNWLRHNVVEAALAAATVCPEAQPLINRIYRRIFYNGEEVQYGSPLECFTFDCLFKQWACEWAIDASKAVDAFNALRAMIASQKLSVHFPVEFRFTDADGTAMSPAYGRKTCWIGIVMYRPYLRDARDTMKYYEGFSKVMTAIGGRPHWAKYYTWGANELEKAYGANWDEFQRLRKSLDPSDMFVNGWWRNFSENGPVVNSTVSRL